MFKRILSVSIVILLSVICLSGIAEENKYIQYYQPAMEKARTLCENAETDLEKYEIIRDWCYKYLHYDYIKQYKYGRYGITSPYPNVKDCFERKHGLCGDISATCVTMMRAVGLEAYYVKGKVYIHYLETEFGYPHAWVECVIDGEWYRFDHVSLHQFSIRKIPDIEYVKVAMY